MRRVCGSVAVLFILAPAVEAGGFDDSIYDANITGTVDMVDYVHRTISIILLKRVGETFRVAADCKIILDRKTALFNRLEPGHRVSLTYNQANSTVGMIVAISQDRIATFEPKERQGVQQPPASTLNARSRVRIDVVTGAQLTVRVTR